MSGVFVDGRELTESEVREMDARIAQVFDDVHHGRPEVGAARPADPYNVRERVADAVKGRDKDKDGHWKQVMEKWGFNWLEPADLNRTIGPQRYIPTTINGLANEKIHDRLGREIPNTHLYWTRDHTEGQWRSDIGKRRPPRLLLRGGSMAFTMIDLIDLFGEPQAFDRWCKERIEKSKKAIAMLREAQEKMARAGIKPRVAARRR